MCTKRNSRLGTVFYSWVLATFNHWHISNNTIGLQLDQVCFRKSQQLIEHFIIILSQTGCWQASTLITSAPISARWRAVRGPDQPMDKSSTLMLRSRSAPALSEQSTISFPPFADWLPQRQTDSKCPETQPDYAGLTAVQLESPRQGTSA